MRDGLFAQAMSLSDEWKKEKMAKEAQKKIEATLASRAGRRTTETVPDSEGEVEVSEVISKTTAKKATGKGKQAAKDKAGKSEDGGALRLR